MYAAELTACVVSRDRATTRSGFFNHVTIFIIFRCKESLVLYRTTDEFSSTADEYFFVVYLSTHLSMQKGQVYVLLLVISTCKEGMSCNEKGYRQKSVLFALLDFRFEISNSSHKAVLYHLYSLYLPILHCTDLLGVCGGKDKDAISDNYFQRSRRLLGRCF